MNQCKLLPGSLFEVVKFDESKKDVIAGLGKVDFYVEDNHDHVEAAHELPNVERVFLMDRPWNQTTQNGIRVKHLDHVAAQIFHLEHI